MLSTQTYLCVEVGNRTEVPSSKVWPAGSSSKADCQHPASNTGTAVWLQHRQHVDTHQKHTTAVNQQQLPAAAGTAG
jgi:hypothetical protein